MTFFGSSESDDSPADEQQSQADVDAAALLAKIESYQQREQERNQQVLRMMNESHKREEILREQLDRQVKAPPAREPELSWWNAHSQQGGTVDQVAQGNVGVSREEMDKLVAARVAEALRQREEQQAKAQQEQQAALQALRQRYATEHAHISGNEALNTYNLNLMNKISALNPNLTPSQVYDLAIQQTEEAAQTFGLQQPSRGASATKSRRSSTSSAYSMPNNMQAPKSNSAQDDVYDARNPQERLEAARQARRKDREAHLQKFK